MGDDNVTINESAVDELDKLPNIYVEVDKDNNFSRVYFETALKSASNATCECDDYRECDCEDEDDAEETVVANMKVDLGLTYPSSINVAEPTEYQDFVTVLQQIMMSSYGATDETVIAE